MGRSSALAAVLGLAIPVVVALAAPSSAATANVTSGPGFSFSPQTVNVAVGDTVTWSGLAFTHTVSADDGSWGFTVTSSSDTFSHTFAAAGTYRYYCAIHGGPNGVGMAGVVVVGSGGTATDTPTVTPTATPTPTPVGRPSAVSAALFGANQVPAVTTSAYGGVRLSLDPSTGQITGQYSFVNLSSSITGAHIHSGGAGTNGPVVVDLTGLVTGTNGSFTRTGVSPTLVDEIAANPANYYFNVHTTANSSGEIRGQLASAPLVVSNALGARLLGSSQVPPVNTTGGGTVILTFDAAAGTINGSWNVTGLSSNATNAHIHAGPAGANGPVVVDFSSQVPAAGGLFNTSTTGVPVDVIEAILYAPAGFYVNVHTTANSSGEVRGQLAPQRIFLPTDPRAAVAN
ncbi:MAG TPA: CHRD domain-containing protein [Chloroflexota bacterium]|nr:CHRD domain-containing protein [Chloroflexota bacterium]